MGELGNKEKKEKRIKTITGKTEERKSNNRNKSKEKEDSGKESEGESGEESEEEMCDELRQEKTAMVMSLMREYFGETSIRGSDVDNLINECFQECDRSIGIEEAIEWSKDERGIPFQFPDDISATDEEELRNVGGDLVKLVQKKQQELAKGRFSAERVAACVPPEYPEYERLMDIAQGVELVVREDFKPSAFPRGPLRQSYLKVAPAVNKILAASHEEGLNIILPSVGVFGKEGVNAVFQHWTENFPRPEGRSITDSSKAKNMRPEEAVNSLEGKEKMKARWGELTFPTVKDLAMMVLREAERVGWSNLRLWKHDIKSAYGQLYVAAKDAILLVCELTDGKCVIHIISGYGFTGTGYAFGPISRVIKERAGGLMAGGLEIYCDDFQGACAESELASEKHIAIEFTTELLGPKAFAGIGERDKYKAGRQLEWIGWQFDLDDGTVSLASKNFKKTLYEFFKVNVDGSVSLREMERLAAFASRYCLIARQMRPFVYHLHAFKNTFNRERKKLERKMMTQEARLDIFLWRTFLILMGLRKKEYCRKIESFAAQVVTGLLKCDSCLTGLGLRLYRLRPNGGVEFMRVASIITPYKLRGQSRFQNTMEFSSVAVGFLIMAEMGWTDVPLKIMGDSRASETWCAKESFRSTVARGAALMYISLGVEFEFWVEDTEFVKGEENEVCDKLSRRSETDEGMGVMSATNLVRALGINPKFLWEVEKSPFGTEMIELCNPLLQLDDDNTFRIFMRRMRGLIDAIKEYVAR